MSKQEPFAPFEYDEDPIDFNDTPKEDTHTDDNGPELNLEKSVKKQRLQSTDLLLNMHTSPVSRPAKITPESPQKLIETVEKVIYSKNRKLPKFTKAKGTKSYQTTFKSTHMEPFQQPEKQIDVQDVQIIPIEGVKIGFPFQPYPLQRVIMSHVLKCIKQQENGIFESPTGTGKTLMILCSTIGWLLQETGRRRAEGISDPLPKIFIASRTQAQAKQMIRELRTKTILKPKIAVLGSRNHYCIHQEKTQWEREANINDKCITLGANCQFFETHEVLAHKLKNELCDIEDLVQKGREMVSCPYYASRMLVEDAQVVFGPYNYFVDPTIRSACGISLKGNILVIDEAHNIEGFCTEAASTQVTISGLRDCLDDLRSLDPGKTINIINMVDVFYKLLCERNNQQYFPEREGEKSYLIWEGLAMYRYLVAEQVHHSWIGACTQELEKLTNGRDQNTIFRPTAEVIESLLKSLSFFFHESQDYKSDFKIAFEERPFRGIRRSLSVPKRDIALHFWCLNSSVIFKSIAEECRSVLLFSGTLSPMASYAKELGVKFKYSHEAPHVIKQDQLFVGVMRYAPGVRLCGDYRTSSTPAYMDAIGDSILQLASEIPSGILVFVPSYQKVTNLRERWKQTGLSSRMSSIKHVFFENEPLMTTKKMYEDYSAACATEKGAIMFCVYRGKMSEGIDFKNELARAVICVGIPYPNTTSIQLNQHQKYHEEFSASKGIMTKSEWYSAQAFRALNQAIGRCIRHKDDWGSIIFLEERMVGPKLESISKWIHTRTRIYQTMDQLSNELKEFHQIQAARNVKLAASDTTDPFTSVQDLSFA